MIKLVKRNDVGFTSVVKEALKYELFIPSFTFHNMLEDYTDDIKELCIYYDEEPVALGMIWRYPRGHYPIPDEDNIGCYVKPAYRRQGIGTKVVQALGGIQHRMWRPGETQDTGKFWLHAETI